MNTNYVMKVIRSCKTNEQLDSCKKWIGNIRYGTKNSNSIFVEFIWKLDMNSVINNHRKILTTGK